MSFAKPINCLDLIFVKKNLVASLELGLTALGVDAVFTLCCDFIQVQRICFNTCLDLSYQVLGCHMIRQKAQVGDAGPNEICL